MDIYLGNSGNAKDIGTKIGTLLDSPPYLYKILICIAILLVVSYLISDVLHIWGVITGDKWNQE